MKYITPLKENKDILDNRRNLFFKIFTKSFLSFLVKEIIDTPPFYIFILFIFCYVFLFFNLRKFINFLNLFIYLILINTELSYICNMFYSIIFSFIEYTFFINIFSESSSMTHKS